jgi:diguanylate cyclase (GGDEF)-like protein
MGYSKKLGPPIVSAAIATIVLTNFATVTIVKSGAANDLSLFGTIWPIALTSGVAVILVMSFLYKSLVDLVQELECREQAAQHQAVHDQLTGLANRTLLEDRLDQALTRVRRDGAAVALHVLDLDRFKQVNDTLGHAAGDLLVQQVSERLQMLLRETDTVARIGGDEFAIIQSAPKNEGDVRRLGARIIEAIGEPFVLRGREARVGVSVGAVLATKDTSDASELVRKADITMYRAKESGRNCFRLFSDEMDAAVQRRDQLESALRDALESGTGPTLHFQPQLDSRGAVTGVEGLLRWKDPFLGEIEPAEVIPIASECGMIDKLGEVTFRQACEAAKRWPNLSIALNLSPLQFRSDDLPSRLWRMAADHEISCDQFELEITESVFVEHGDYCEHAIRQLRGSGFRIALDDFGTGYSSLSYLQRFPVDTIKLDRSFLNSAQPAANMPIVCAAVTLGHALGLQVLAEGISTKEQEQVALEAGCDGLQGHLYAPAMSSDELDAYLEMGDAPRLASAA